MYKFNSRNPHYGCTLHDRLRAEDNITDGETVYMHMTINSIVVWLQAVFDAMETFDQANNMLSLSFTYLKLLEPIGAGEFAKPESLQWNKWFCINSAETCYHAAYQSRSLPSSSWGNAEHTCNQKEATLLTINTEEGWHLLFYWFAGRMKSFHMLRKSFEGSMLQTVCPAVGGTPGVCKAEEGSIILTYFRQWLDNPKRR